MHIHARMRTYIHTHTHTHAHALMHACMYMHTHSHTRTSTRRTQMHTFTNQFWVTHVHTCVCTGMHYRHTPTLPIGLFAAHSLVSSSLGQQCHASFCYAQMPFQFQASRRCVDFALNHICREGDIIHLLHVIPLVSFVIEVDSLLVRPDDNTWLKSRYPDGNALLVIMNCFQQYHQVLVQGFTQTTFS